MSSLGILNKKTMFRYLTRKGGLAGALASGFFCSLMAACQPALPTPDRGKEIYSNLELTLHAAGDARQNVASCREQASRSEKLLIEARELLKKTREADAHCAALTKKAVKEKARRKRALRRKARRTPTPTPTKDVQWSPSDAPDEFFKASKEDEDKSKEK